MGRWVGGWVGWVGLGGGDALSTDPRLTPSGRLVTYKLLLLLCYTVLHRLAKINGVPQGTLLGPTLSLHGHDQRPV